MGQCLFGEYSAYDLTLLVSTTEDALNTLRLNGGEEYRIFFDALETLSKSGGAVPEELVRRANEYLLIDPKHYPALTTEDGWNRVFLLGTLLRAEAAGELDEPTAPNR